MSTSPIHFGSSQGIISLTNSYAWQQWGVYPIRTVLIIGIIGVVIPSYGKDWQI